MIAYQPFQALQKEKRKIVYEAPGTVNIPKIIE